MNYRGGVCRRPLMMGETDTRQGMGRTANGSFCNNSYDIGGKNMSPYNTDRNYPSLAMVYSPIQQWRDIYSGEMALVNGTIFAELDKPFKGRRDNGGCYR